MSSFRKRRGATVAEFLVVWLIVLFIWLGVITTALAFWTQRNLDFWATHFSGYQRHVPFIIDYLASIPAPLNIVANVIMEICRYFI